MTNNETIKLSNVNALEHRPLTSTKTGEIYSKSLILTEFLKYQDIFVHHEILGPGKRASAPHRHTTREEMVFVLEGYPTVHIGDRIIQLKPGDFLGFSPDAQDLHFIENNTQEEIRFLVICSNPKTDQVIYQ